MRKFFGLLATAALVAAPTTRVSADEGGPNFTFGASTSYTFDANDPDGQFAGENRKVYSNGESDESFNIDLVQIGASGTRGPVSYGAKIDFGDWTKWVGDDIDGDIALQEMFLTIETPWARVTAGRMPTPVGYEVLEPWANPNISRSRAWFYHSISHDGLALSGELGGVSLMAAIVNGYRVNDPIANNADDEYGVIASAGVPIGDADLRFSAIYSEETDTQRKFEFNGVLSGNYANTRYGLEGTWFDNDIDGPNNRQSAWDVTLYGGATWGAWSTDLRFGYTDEEGTNSTAVAGTSDNGIWSFTATGGYQIVEGVVVRAEYRVDGSEGDIFDDDDGLFRPRDMINTVQLQLLWTPATGQD